MLKVTPPSDLFSHYKYEPPRVQLICMTNVNLLTVKYIFLFLMDPLAILTMHYMNPVKYAHSEYEVDCEPNGYDRSNWY